MHTVTIDGLEGFRKWEGRELFRSAPMEITKAKIQDFCRALDNTEWLHWDEERCRNSPLGDIVAPAMLIPSLFPTFYWESVEIINIPQFLFLGSDRVRIVSPIRVGSELVATARVERIEERGKGIAVFYDTRFDVVGDDDGPAAVGMFIVRYWE